MDNFAEQLVRKQPNSSDKFKRAAALVGGTLITVLLVLLAFINIGSIFSLLGFVLTAGSGFGTYFFVQEMYVEYEYTFTNGELDIDKIVARKKRIELVASDVKRFTAFGKYDENIPESDDMTVVISSDNIASHEYYADFEHEEYGKTRLIFSPNEKMLENIKKFLPRNLKNQL